MEYRLTVNFGDIGIIFATDKSVVDLADFLFWDKLRGTAYENWAVTFVVNEFDSMIEEEVYSTLGIYCENIKVTTVEFEGENYNFVTLEELNNVGIIVTS